MQINQSVFLKLNPGDIITLPSEEEWEVVATSLLPQDPRSGRVNTAIHVMNVEGQLQIMHFYPGNGVTDEEGTFLPEFNESFCDVTSPKEKAKKGKGNIPLPTGF